MNRVGFGGRLFGQLEVVLFGHRQDNVHHIRNAAGAFAALVEFPVDHGRNDDLPRIGPKQLQDNLLDLPVGDHIALADKHGQAEALLDGRIKRRTNLIVNVRYCRGGRGAETIARPIRI